MQCHSLSKHNGVLDRTQWYNLLVDYFCIELDARSAERWWNELVQQTPEVTNAIMCSAIKWASDPANNMRPDYKATLTDVKKWLRLFMARQKESMRSDCGVCNSTGWADYYHGWKSDWTVAQYLGACVTKVPCMCVNSQAVMANKAVEMKQSLKKALEVDNGKA
jgi:hypothetical protein